jgi:hypothetical protein
MLSCLSTAAIACAQYAPPPLSYTLVQQNSLYGPATTTSVYRDGSKAAIDWIDPKYGMIMRILIAQPGSAPKVAFETIQMTFAAPPAAMFIPGCPNGPSAHR